MKRWLAVFLVCSFNGFADEAPTLSPASIRLSVGEKMVLAVAPAGTVLTFEAIDQTIVKLDPATLTITALKPGAVELRGKNAADDAANTVKVNVDPAAVKIAALEKALIQGETRTITLPPAIGDLSGPFTLASTNEAIAKVSADSTAIEATSTLPGDQSVALNVLANGNIIGTITAVVREAIVRVDAASPFAIVEGTSKDLGVKLIGKQGTQFTPDQRPLKAVVKGLAVVSVSDTGTVQANTLAGDNQVSTTIELSSAEGENNNMVTRTVPVTVLLGAGSIIAETNLPFLPRNGRVLIEPKLRDRKGDPLRIRQITWALKDPANDKFIALAPTDKSLLVLWKDAGTAEETRPNFVEIVVNARSDQDAVITDTLIIRMSGEVAGFAPLKVRLNIMDDQTATDLYGKKTAEEYFVTRVRLNNNLMASRDPNLQGASILAFSESIEVAVRYEKRRLGENGKVDKKKLWEPVSEEDLVDFEVPPNDSAATQPHVDPRCRGFLTYRPYMFEMMVNSVDRRDERSTRSKVLRSLQAVGTLASVVTSVAVPGPQSDFPLAIEKYSSLFIPGFEKLWPTLRETHRQNLVSQTMKTIEEIPFGSDLSRVLFFPKREFRGLLADYQTRVARICPFHFDIEVAIIQKKQSVRGGQ